MSLLRHSRRHQAGNAVLEFAVGSGVLVAVFAGTFQFGLMFLQYNKLQTAVMQAARYASLQPYSSTTTTPPAALVTAVQNMVLYGAPTAGTTALLPGLTASNVSLTVTFANGVPSTVKVSVTGYTLNAVVATIALTNKPQVTYTYQGIYSP